MQKVIPPRINFLGDKLISQSLKGKAMAFFNAVISGCGKVKSGTRSQIINGSEIRVFYYTDAFGQKTGVVDIFTPLGGGEEFAGFIFLPRYTAEDQTNGLGTEGDVKDSIKFPGQSMRNWLRTNKNGFVDIVEDTGFTAGYQYWTSKAITLSWESAISPLPAAGVSNHFRWNVIIGAARFDSPGQIYLNGKKVGHVDPQTIYAAKVGGHILAIVNNGGAFSTMYTNLSGTGWVYKQYSNMAIKKAHINSKGTKLVVIAITDYNVNYPNDYYEAVVEYNIVLQNKPSEPVLLIETSRIVQYGLMATVENQKTFFSDPDEWVQIFSENIITDAWYDKDDVLQTEIVINPIITRMSDYSYTVTNPKLTANYAVNIACNINTFSKSATAVLLMRNNPYVDNSIVITSNMTGAVNYDLGTYFATNEQTMFDSQEKITFGVISNTTSTDLFDKQAIGVSDGSGDTYPLPFWTFNQSGIPYAADLYAASAYFVDLIVSIQPTPHLLSRFDDPTDVLSDRFKNKLYFWQENGVQKYAAFTAGKDEFNNFTDHLPVKAIMLDAITDAITSSDDILGVI